MSTYELAANISITITGPALVVVSPPAPRGRAPGYDPAQDPQLEMMREHLAGLGYDLAVSVRTKEGATEQADVPTQGRFPPAKPRVEGPIQGEPDR